ncbi:hypothetical protein [Aeromonas veronii]|uniref:hypothetical protein n=1 Tax=Aeromonas veronii TaxID=654 RepID=UPI003D209167
MFEKNLIACLKVFFKSIPVYAFFIPEGAPETAVCFENAGQGTQIQYYNGTDLDIRNIKLTVSSNDVSTIFDDSDLHKYISGLSKVGDLQILHARITGFHDNFSQSQMLFERTYSISFKLKRY